MTKIRGTNNPDVITPGFSSPGVTGVPSMLPTRFADTIYGLNGNDKIDGGAGADIMYGGAGYDSYYVDSMRDKVIEMPIKGSILCSVRSALILNGCHAMSRT
jgi:Ca2+-binding RTX toxin-like protein